MSIECQQSLQVITRNLVEFNGQCTHLTIMEWLANIEDITRNLNAIRMALLELTFQREEIDMKKHNAKTKRAKKTATPSEIAKAQHANTETALGVRDARTAQQCAHSDPDINEGQNEGPGSTEPEHDMGSGGGVLDTPLVSEVGEFADDLPDMDESIVPPPSREADDAVGTPQEVINARPKPELTADEIKAHESPESLASSGDATPHEGCQQDDESGEHEDTNLL